MMPLVRQAFSGPQLRPAILAGGLAGGLFWFIVFPALDRLHSDLLNYLLPFDVPASDSVIVAIDEPSFAAFGTGWPWPRELHGRLVEQLAALGAGQIVFDLLFAEPSEPQSDGYFAAAIAAAGKVILAADITGSDQQGRIETRPMPLFMQAGAKAGFAGVQRDPDQVVRRHPGLADTLSSLAVEPAGRTQGLPDSRLLIRYIGPDHSFDYISFYRFFIDQTVPPEGLAGKTVFIGFDVRAATGTDDYRPDSFATPYPRFTGQLTPGVELHATLYHNLKHDGFVMLLAGWQRAGLLAVWVCVCGFVNAHFRPGRAILIGGGLQLAGLAVSASFWKAGLFLPLLSFGPLFLVAYAAAAGHAYLGQLHQKRQIKQAFSQYLSPDMVTLLLANPDRLVLGGHRRMMTILFCDIRGFTGISEALRGEPEKLVGLINRLLTALTADILACGGTIDKYMGDCVMAFWNAPLAVPDHAGQAVAAARQMQQTLARLNQEAGIAELAGGPVRVGIGIATGESIIGNMGSQQRFDYTVLGDRVNLAARLESLTKSWQLPVLLCEQTARLLQEKRGRDQDLAGRLVQLGPVRLAGMRRAEIVFALLDQPLMEDQQAALTRSLAFCEKGDGAAVLAEIAGLSRPASPLCAYAAWLAERVQNWPETGPAARPKAGFPQAGQP